MVVGIVDVMTMMMVDDFMAMMMMMVDEVMTMMVMVEFI